ncbi:MAG: hypothetical protein JW966_13620 [Anaerolineae bacterium]|nr:hypothetical protein [Anaerolineae bacterium]
MSDDPIPNYEGKKLDDETVHVRYRFGDSEMEAEGSEEYVNQHTLLFFSQVRSESSSNTDMPDIEENNMPLSVNSGMSKNTSGNAQIKPQDLLGLYHKMVPSNQREQILVITYFYQMLEGHEYVSLDDFSEAYDILRRVPVETPRNLKSSIRNVVDRSNLLFTPIRGQFALTHKGKEYVEQLPEKEG